MRMPRDKKRRAERVVPYSLRLRAAVLCAGVLILGFGVLVARLYELQIVQGETLKTEARAQQVKDTVLEPERGNILDADGHVLAKSSVVYNVSAGPDIFSKKEKDDSTRAARMLARDVARELAPILQKDEEELFGKLSQYDSKYQILAKGLDKPAADQVEAIRKKYRLGMGITCERVAVREYPYGDFLASVLGFTNSKGHGVITGVELSYDEILAGKEGRRISARTRLDDEMPTDSTVVYPAEDGSDLVLTVRADIQTVVEKYLNMAVREHAPSERATAIVMDVNTGAILAMASKPDFDPNQPAVILDAAQSEALEAMPETTEEEQAAKEKAFGDARSILWRNKAISELYDPGSVFKTVTTSSALDAGTSGAYTTYVCNSGYDVLGQHYNCFEFHAHGTETISDILKNSCNVGTIQVAQGLGIRRFSDYFNAYGLTGRTGIDLPNEAGSIYHSGETMSQVDLASSSFGQGVGLTPIQVMTAVSAVVNGGRLVTPHVVDRIQDAQGNVVKEIGANVKRQVISEEVSEAMRGYMERVIVGDPEENGQTANRYAGVYGYRIGGKSGTSDKLEREKSLRGEYVSSFLGVAPINDPQIAVLVVVDNPHSWTNLTTYIAVPVAGNIFKEILPMLGIQPEYTAEQLAKTEIAVTNVAGSPNMSHLMVAQAEMNRRGLNYRVIGNGDIVLHQFPEYGEIPRGSTVYLYTESADDLMVEVPDLTGLSGEQAAQLLKSGGLNVRLQGEGVCVAQDVPALTEQPMGKVVTVTLG